MRFRNSPQLWAPRRAALQSHVPNKVTRFLADDGQNRKAEVMRSRIGTGKPTCVYRHSLTWTKVGFSYICF
jgi:hypothetical protein